MQIKFLFPALFVLLSACASLPPIEVPEEFKFTRLASEQFTLAAWVKTKKGSKLPFKVYIEGDGNAFNAYGYPTKDPTPKNNFMRALAFGDKHENIIYLARPCQFIMSNACEQKYWTKARFAKEIIDASASGIKQLAGRAELILIGFSGGAQIAGLIGIMHKDLNIKKIITISGNLDHMAWTRYHHLPPLSASLNLADFKEEFLKFDSFHYAGEKDKIMPWRLIENFAGKSKTAVIKGASHANYPDAAKMEIRAAI